MGKRSFKCPREFPEMWRQSSWIPLMMTTLRLKTNYVSVAESSQHLNWFFNLSGSPTPPIRRWYLEVTRNNWFIYNRIVDCLHLTTYDRWYSGTIRITDSSQVMFILSIGWNRLRVKWFKSANRVSAVQKHSKTQQII